MSTLTSRITSLSSLVAPARVLLASLLGLAVAAVAAPAAVAGVAPVVGGAEVPAGTWPTVVAVIGEYGVCTGVLIAPDVVLTAGHCVDLQPTEVITHTVDLGTPHPGDHIPVKWSRAYPRWWDRYDVGVVMLDHVARGRPLPIASACLTNQRLADGAPLTVVGFGLTTADASDHNTVMHEAELPVIDPFCLGAPGCEPSVRPNGEFVAGGRGTDSCFGDSGGPALLSTEDGPALAGIVSRGLAVDGAPCSSGGIYVRADKVVAWAQSVTQRRFERVTCERRADDPEAPDAGEDVAGGGCRVSGVGPGGEVAALAFALAVTIRRRRRRGRPRIA